MVKLIYMKKKYTTILILSIIFNSFSYGQTFVKDFYSIKELVTINDQSFFVASDATHGLELWKSNGTKKGTDLIKDINTISNGDPSHLTVFNGEVYFSANDGFFGQELWKTNGTETGTILVKNIHKSFGQGSFPSNFTIFNNELFFTATDNYINGNFQLWKTDGTENGTIKLYDGGGTRINDLIVANNKLYLINGSLNEFDVITKTLTPILIDYEYPVISKLNAFNNGIYFITSINYSGQNIRLYRLDGAGNVILLKEFVQPQYGDIDIFNFTQVGTEVYFSITTDFNSGTYTDALWKTNGTSSGTAQVKSFDWDRHLSGSNISNFIEYKNELYFNAGSQNNYTLWKSNGINTGTIKVLDTPLSDNIDLFVFNDLLYFSNYSNLWSTDGTLENTKKFSDLFIPVKVSDDYFNIKSAQNMIFFEANFQEQKALYTTVSNPIIEVKKNYSALNNKDIINFEAKIDSVNIITININNKGNKDLVFSKIEIVGHDFYIDGQQQGNVTSENSEGNFPQLIKPNKQNSFEIIFFPGSPSLKKGTLNILSNDVINPNFVLDLVGFAENKIGLSPIESINLDKEIIFNYTNNNIVIDNNKILENSLINSSIGFLNIPNNVGNFSFEFASGEDNSDNQYFIINDNELKTNAQFDFEIKSTYSIKIKATNQNTNEIIEENIFIRILDELEDLATEPCSSDLTDVAFGLNDVAFIDNQNVVAVGSHGSILKSTDGGDTWRKIRSDIYNHLYKLQFTSNTIGYTIGNKMLKTDDAGESWYPIELPKSASSYPSPDNLVFANSEIGFVFGRDGKIFKTEDGGRYWKQTNYGNNTLNSGYFINESTGYICGNSKILIKTIDEGKTWENIVLDFPEFRYDTKFIDIFFLNDQVGFILGDRGEIIKTIDGGNTWAFLTQVLTSGRSKIKFKNENEGYIVGDFNGIQIYKTTDGGITWNSDSINDYGSLLGISFSKDGNKTCIVGHGTSCCSGYTTGSVIYKKELENNWETKSYLSVDTYGFSTVHFDGDNGLIFSQFSSGKTSDGGVQWQKITPPETIIFQVEVLNNNVYLLGQNNIYKSSDSGITWSTLSTSNYFKKLFFINEQVIYANAQERGIFKSTDGGVNWVNINLDPSFGLDLYFLNENEGYSVGFGGIFKTLDGGNTWNQVMLEPMDGGEQPNIYSINIFNNIGMMGSSVGLLKSTDSGNTWTRANKNLGGIVKFIHATNEVEWFIGTDDRILKTEDGGITWKSIYYGEEINDAHFATGKIYLVGYKNFTEITTKNSPTIPGYIEGNTNVASQSKEEYSVIKESGINYKWTVSGDNEINYIDNKAHVLWKTSGTHVVTVTPFDGCGEGTWREKIVTVEDIQFNPAIEGNTEVVQFSMNNEYLTSLNSGSRYSWFVKGHENFSAIMNTASIDWGAEGIGEIEVIETKNLSGARKSAKLSVNINVVLGIDDIQPNNNMIVYPNPVEGQMHISVNNQTIYNTAKIELYDMTGRLFKSHIFKNNDNLDLNIRSIPSGIYIVKVRLDNKKYIKKVIKI